MVESRQPVPCGREAAFPLLLHVLRCRRQEALRLEEQEDDHEERGQHHAAGLVGAAELDRGGQHHDQRNEKIHEPQNADERGLGHGLPPETFSKQTLANPCRFRLIAELHSEPNPVRELTKHHCLTHLHTRFYSSYIVKNH